jgi:hypothetical protein
MSDQFAHPESEEDLVGLVQEAVRQGPQLRVRGAGHSAAHAMGERQRPRARRPGTVRLELDDVKRFDSGVVLLTYHAAS